MNRVVALLTALAASGTAQAAPDCDAVLAAARAIGTAPQYRSVLVATSPARRRPVEREQVVIGDVIYATSTSGGRWMKLTMTQANRDELAAGLMRYPPHHCSSSQQVLDGRSMQVMAYQQDVSGPGSATSEMWVAEDGRPQRIENREGPLRIVITFTYGNVKAPDFH